MFTTQLLRQALATLTYGKAPASMKTATLNRRIEVIRKLDGILESFQKREAIIQADRSLSQEGKGQQLSKAASDMLNELKWFSRAKRDVQEANDRFKKLLFTIERPKGDLADRIIQFLSEQEIRANLADLPKHEIDTAYLKASQAGHDDTMLALSEEPGGSLVSEEVKERALAARAERLHPNELGLYQQTIHLLDSYQAIEGSLRGWMRDLTVPEATISGVLGVDPGYKEYMHDNDFRKMVKDEAESEKVTETLLEANLKPVA